MNHPGHTQNRTAFICHASTDKDFARQLGADLEKFGIRTWLDERAILVGDSILESIQTGLEYSNFTIVILSDIAIQRPWVRMEIAASFNIEADLGKKKILPALIENCELPLFLRDKRYADFRVSYDSGLTELLKAFGIDGPSPSPTGYFNKRAAEQLDIVEQDGSLVHYERKTSAIFLSQNINSVVNAFTAEGRMGDFEVSPGEIDNVSVESGVTYVCATVPSTLKKYDTIDRTFTMKMWDSFLEDSEYWEGKQLCPTDSYILIVKFPPDRPPKLWRVDERDATLTSDSNWNAMYSTENGRPILRLEVTAPVLYRSYVLRWWW